MSYTRQDGALDLCKEISRAEPEDMNERLLRQWAASIVRAAKNVEDLDP